jgi:hypothetical protein
LVPRAGFLFGFSRAFTRTAEFFFAMTRSLASGTSAWNASKRIRSA